MLEIRKKYVNQNMPNRDIFEKIREYFYEHKTVLTTYGSLKGYKIKDINFDKNPNNTSVKIKNINGDKKNISIINYYKNQYNIDGLEEEEEEEEDDDDDNDNNENNENIDNDKKD